MSKAELNLSSSPNAVDIEAHDSDLLEVWHTFHAATLEVDRLEEKGDSRTPADQLALATAQAQRDIQKAALVAFGWTGDISRPWYFRSVAPPSGVFSLVTASVEYPAGFDPNLLIPSVAAFLRMPESAIFFWQSATACTFSLLVCFSSDDPAGVDPTSLYKPIGDRLTQHGGRVLNVGSTLPTKGPCFGATPWSINPLAFLRAAPVDTLHVGPQGLVGHVRECIIALVYGQQPDARGITGMQAVHNLDKYVKKCTRWDLGDGHTTVSMRKKGVLKLGCLTGHDSMSLHSHITAALSLTDVIFDPDVRLDVAHVCEFLEHYLALCEHIPFHCAQDPAGFEALMSRIDVVSVSLVDSMRKTLGHFQKSNFALPKTHAAREASRWMRLWGGLRWVRFVVFPFRLPLT